MTEPRHAVSAHDVALQEIRELILTGAYPPGAQIQQETLAGKLGISVIPVREALKSLQGEGQVVFAPRRGFFVSRYSREDLLELCTIRSALESMAIRQGIEHVGDAELALMAAAASDMRAADEAQDVIAFVTADRRFHFALLTPGCGPQLLRVLTSLWDRSDHYRAAFLSEAAHRHSNHDEHAAILAAAAAHDADTLIALLDAHRLAALQATK